MKNPYLENIEGIIKLPKNINGEDNKLNLELNKYYGAIYNYQWKLKKGTNKIEMRAVNSLGVRGPSSSFEVFYKPVSE